MKRPKSVTILGQRITIEYIKDYPAENALALFDSENLKITIKDTVYYDKYLIHECVHAALYVSGLSNLLSSEMEEAICTACEHALFGVYKFAQE